MVESWGRSFGSKEEEDAETRRFTDIPGSVECRNGFAVLGTHTLGLCRRRGSDPVFLVEGTVEGTMVEALRRIQTAASRRF
ncbi:MAG: hypothetical protein ACRDS0_29460 [Pseudonocardiaceae bacterium]